MNKLVISQKKEWAQLLFVKEQLTQKEIAERTGTTEKTISKWVNDGNWASLKASITITKEEQLRRFYEQINEVTASIQRKPEGQRYANNKEADILIKLTTAANKLETETSISTTIQEMRGFKNWLQAADLAKAKEFIVLQDSYIKSLLR